MTERVARIVEELRTRLEALYGSRLERLVLFGSQARGDAAPDSDVDVLVVLNGDVVPGVEIERTSEVVADLALRCDTPISRVFVSSERFRREATPFLHNVRTEGVAV